MRIIKEEELLKELADQTGWDGFDEERFSAEAERVDAGPEEIRVVRKMAA